MTALLSLCVCVFLAGASAITISRVDPVGGSCILDLKNLPDKYEPLYLQKRTDGKVDIIEPETEGRRGIIALRKGEDLLLSCPGLRNRNSLQPTNEAVSRAVCSSGTSLTVNGKNLAVDQLACKERPTAQTRVTNRRCANNQGVIVELGFETEGWLKVMEVCHNIAKSETYFAHHKIHGASLAGKVIRPGGTRPTFSSGGRDLYPGLNPNDAYLQRNQLALLARLLGPQSAKLFDNKLRFLARGHLAPDADFLYSPLQFLTYFYVNVAPQWQAINAGNWLRVEENTRRAAIALGEDVEVVTGTEGVLRLPTDKGVEREIYLSDSRLPVPEHYWKVVRSPRDDSCIVFVATNNPFAAGPPERRLCKDVCRATGWPLLQDSPPARGYVYCCEYKDFKSSVPYVPDLACKNTLRSP